MKNESDITTASSSSTLSTKTKNKMIKTARALALCITEELDDSPTTAQLREIIDRMEEEHGDIPCDIKTLRKYLTNPD
ncbi:MAG: hypothetical protein CMI00_13100 [Oceanospirillaceae bacterium]|nr:hypothetical protein [Oceanospirillaceae bacterium]